MNYYLEAYRNYAKFSGRANKEEYYGFNRWNLMVLVLMFGLNYGFDSNIPTLSYVVIMIIPAISLSVRRLHDVGESGWHMFKWNGKKKMREDSVKGKNQYGEAPKNL